MGEPLFAWLITAIGLFYCWASIVAIRAFVTNLFLDIALTHIEKPPRHSNHSSSKDDQDQLGKEVKLESESQASEIDFRQLPWAKLWLLDGSYIVGLSGIAALVQWSGAPWLFALGALWQAIYLGYIAPKLSLGRNAQTSTSLASNIEQAIDEESRQGRKQTENAFVIYIIAASITSWAAWQGLLDDIGSMPTWRLLLAGFLAIGATAWYLSKAWQLRKLMVDGPLSTGPSADSPSANSLPGNSAISETSFVVQLDPHHAHFFFGTDLNEPLYDAFNTLDLPIEVEVAFDDWLRAWILAVDQNDVFRKRLVDDNSQSLIDSKGKLAFENLIQAIKAEKTTQKLSVDQFSLNLAIRAYVPIVHPNRVIVRAAFEAASLLDPDQISHHRTSPEYYSERECFTPDALGVSMQLSQDFYDWSELFDQQVVDHGRAPSAWEANVLAALNAQGEALTKRLVVELAASQRDHVVVTYEPIQAANAKPTPKR
jgi:hypothetical protein